MYALGKERNRRASSRGAPITIESDRLKEKKRRAVRGAHACGDTTAGREEAKEKAANRRSRVAAAQSEPRERGMRGSTRRKRG